MPNFTNTSSSTTGMYDTLTRVWSRHINYSVQCFYLPMIVGFRRKETHELKALLILTLVTLTMGCTTPYARQWQSHLWHTPQEIHGATVEIGKLENEGLTFEMICTQFRQLENSTNSFIGISVSCRNNNPNTYLLEFNPLQVIDARNSIVKPLPLDHVMYKLYGGNWREAAQIARLNTSYPSSHGDTLVDSIFDAVVSIYRAYEQAAIITEFHDKEALPYNLYYESFAPTSLPAGISTQWTQYYPGTTDSIRVILEGGSIDNKIMFTRPPPSKPKKREPDGNILIAFVLIIGFFSIVRAVSK